MNKEFEEIVMNAYAELCIMWRVAHVTDQNQANDFDAKLKSLEAVVAAFDLSTPMEERVPAPAASASAAPSSPAPKEDPPASSVPAEAPPSSLPRAEGGLPPAASTVPAGPPAGGMVLED